MSATAPIPLAVKYAASQADLDAFMEYVSKKGDGKPLTFDAWYNDPRGWGVIIICEGRGLVHKAAWGRRFARLMRQKIARQAAAKGALALADAGINGAYAICDAWDSRALLAMQRNRENIKPN